MIKGKCRFSADSLLNVRKHCVMSPRSSNKKSKACAWQVSESPGRIKITSLLPNIFSTFCCEINKSAYLVWCWNSTRSPRVTVFEVHVHDQTTEDSTYRNQPETQQVKVQGTRRWNKDQLVSCLPRCLRVSSWLKTEGVHSL